MTIKCKFIGKMYEASLMYLKTMKLLKNSLIKVSGPRYPDILTIIIQGGVTVGNGTAVKGYSLALYQVYLKYLNPFQQAELLQIE